MNDDLLKKAGGGNYWQELLERIRDIRSSEKMVYRQVLDGLWNWMILPSDMAKEFCRMPGQ